MSLARLPVKTGEQPRMLRRDGLRRFGKELCLAAIFTNPQPLSLKGREILMMDFYLVFPSGIVADFDFTANQFQANLVFLPIKTDAAGLVHVPGLRVQESFLASLNIRKTE